MSKIGCTEISHNFIYEREGNIKDLRYLYLLSLDTNGKYNNPIDGSCSAKVNDLLAKVFKEDKNWLDEKKWRPIFKENEENYRKFEQWQKNEKNSQTRDNEESRKYMLKICGMFKLNIEETVEFLSKAICERAFFKDVYDTVVYYCINNEIECNMWDKIYNECNRIIKDTPHTNAYTSTRTIATSNLYNQLSDVHPQLSLCQNAKDCRNCQDFRCHKPLKDFILDNADALEECSKMETARREIETLLKQANEISQKAKEELPQEYTIDFLIDNPFRFKELFKEVVQTDDRIREDFDSELVNMMSIETAENLKYHKFLRSKFPTAQKISNIKNNRKKRYGDIRRTLIVLHFFVFASKDENKKLNGVKRSEKYILEVNVLLTKCGFAKLWEVDCFERIFLFCIAQDDASFPSDYQFKSQGAALQAFRAFAADVFYEESKKAIKNAANGRGLDWGEKSSKKDNDNRVMKMVYGFELDA